MNKNQQLLRDRDIYPRELCDRLEDIISCNKSRLSVNGGSGKASFLDDGMLLIQLTIDGDNSFLSDEGGCIVLIRGKDGSIRANAYYGRDCEVDFIPRAEVYSLDSCESYIQALKDFMGSWSFEKGDLSATVIIVDRFEVYQKITSDDAFKNVFILYSE